VLTTDAGARRCAPLADRAEVVSFGDGSVDLARALNRLGHRGAGIVLCEGGPSLNGQLVAGDLIDEWRLTVSPVLAGGTSARPAVGPTAPDPARFALDRVLVGDDLLFLRLLRR
jgi:riboflavin biosynthesis pyrimidine reductase